MDEAKKNSLLAELDALFSNPSSSSKKKDARKSPRIAPPAVKALPPKKYWTPTAVVLYTSSWKCTCGNSGKCAPQLMLREHLGESRVRTRLRPIGKLANFNNLPRECCDDEPSLLTVCPECLFAASPTTQLEFPFSYDKEAFFAEVLDAVMSGIYAQIIAEPSNYQKLPEDLRETRTFLISQ